MPFLYPRFQQPQAFDGWELLLGLLAMLVALYLDFGGYTDIARGSARLLGIELVKNFEYPFTSRNPGELWQRWHISLTTWMRDYVFVAFPGSPPSRSSCPPRCWACGTGPPGSSCCGASVTGWRSPST